MRATGKYRGRFATFVVRAGGALGVAWKCSQCHACAGYRISSTPGVCGECGCHVHYHHKETK